MRISDWSSDVCSSDLKDAAHDIALRIARTAPRIEGMHVYGPALAPLAMLRGRHRFRLLVHARRALDVQDVIRDWLGGLVWKPDRKSTRLNYSHQCAPRMPASAITKQMISP